MHRRFFFVVVAAALFAVGAIAQAPPPPPFSLQLQWNETGGASGGTWSMWGRTVTRTEWVPSNGHTSPERRTTFELSEAQMNAIIALVPAFPKQQKLTLPVVERPTSRLSASLVVNGSVLAIEGSLPQATTPKELTALAAIKAALEAAQPPVPTPPVPSPLLPPPAPTVG